MKPNKYTILKLICAAVAVLAGGAYLLYGSDALAVVLPVMFLCFTAIGIFAVREIRAAGGRGVLVLFTALACTLVAFFAFIGMCAYFAQR